MSNKISDARLVRLTRDLTRDVVPTTLDEQQRHDIRHALVELQALRSLKEDSNG